MTLSYATNYRVIFPPFWDSYQTAFFLATQMVLNGGNVDQRIKSLSLLFEIGRNRPIPLPMSGDKDFKSEFNECSLKNWTACNRVKLNIVNNSHLNWTLDGRIAVLVAALFCFFISSRIREKFWQFTMGFGFALIPLLFSAVKPDQPHLIWGATMVLLLILFDLKRVREKV